MNVDALEIQCPACGGTLTYDPRLGKLRCEYCGSTYDVSAFDQKEPAKARARVPEITKSYDCPACGAKLVCDETTIAVCCPYCGNHAILEGRVSGEFRPEWLIPFETTKEEAIAALKKHCENKRFLPKLFLEQNHVEDVQGVYVPFWLFDCEADGEVRLRAQNCKGKYRYVYNLIRGGILRFRGVPSDGSTKMPDKYMDSIGPFDYSKEKEFSPAYMPGFLAERYDQKPEELFGTIKDRVEEAYLTLAQKSAKGYEQAVPYRTRIEITEEGAHYAMFPVWLLATKCEGQNYLFAMNGQTGKLIGDLPIDPLKCLKYFLGVLFLLHIIAAMISGRIFGPKLKGIVGIVINWGAPFFLAYAGYMKHRREMRSVVPDNAMSSAREIDGEFTKSEDAVINTYKR